MKLKLLLVLLLFNWIASYASGFKTFVPKENGFVPVEIKVEKKSINNICKFLGYNSEEFYTYNDYDLKDSKVFIVIFKSFSDQLVCVLTDDNIESITQKDVDNYLVNFNLKDDFDSYDIESTLEDGVKNKSLSKKFMSEVFNNQTANANSFIAMDIGYELHFTNGVLSSYKPSDGLNKWAKSWKNEMPERYRQYYNEASSYQTNENDILNELNIQADAFANTHNGVMNEYIKFHTNNNGTVNYKMLLVAHYNESINLQEFKMINKGRYDLSNEFSDQDSYKRTTYRVNNGLYTFDENGKLINSYTSE
ncbi:hypothetical protein [Maribacter sp. R77961]|uniref:hypothetical protein n=1 Tax=Maribacter sp. R77961 TaxID=3093871 RepID=UPI0037CAF267